MDIRNLRYNLGAILMATAAALLTTSVMAASFEVLHSFKGPDGETPAAPLVQGPDGFFYGVAARGGNFTVLPPDGAGTAFRVDVNGNFTTLHIFTGPDGAVPINLVLGLDGFFYGTTRYGGPPFIDSFQPGSGVLFRMDLAGNVTVLRKFVDEDGGFFPGPLVVGSDGALYGPAMGGLSVLNVFPGLVYRFDPATDDFRVLHKFDIAGGRDPMGPLFQGGDGDLYGTTWKGGPSNTGVIYKVSPAGKFTLLHTLGVSEGWEPNGNLVQSADGSVYGTIHGSNGSIFRLDSNGAFKILHRFDNFGSNGLEPVSGLIEGRDGYFYGTAPIGGQPVTSPNRYGVAYRMDRAGTVTVLHTFTGPDGRRPRAALVQGGDGMLYGSTIVGGERGLGVLFRIEPDSALTRPESADSATITLAQYRSRRQLSVQATSTSASATLTAYVTATGQVIATLANDGGGNYSGEFAWPVNPRDITVRSSLGGSATKAVTNDEGRLRR